VDNTIQAITYTVARTRNPNLWINYNFLFRMMDKPEEQAGERIQVPVVYAQHPVEKFVGMEPSTAARTEWQTAAYFEWTTQRAPMTYALIDKLKNSGNKQSIIGYVKSLMTNSEKSFADSQATDFCGSGTEAALRQFNYFQHVANNAANTLATGTVFGTLDKNVLVDNNGVKVWAGKVKDLAGAGHGPTRTNLITSFFEVADGDYGPTVCVMHPEVLGAVVSFSAGTSSALQRYVGRDKLSIGFVGYEIEGIPIHGDRHMPFSKTVEATNKIFFVDTKSTKVIVHADCNMLLEPWAKLPLQQAWYACRVLAGNTVCDDPRRNLVVTNFAWNTNTD